MAEKGERPRLVKLLLDGLKVALRDADQARRASPDAAPAEATERVAELPPDSFEAGVHAAKTLREFGCPVGENPLGPYVCPPDVLDPEDRRTYYPFQVYWRRLFRKVNQEQVETLQDFMAWLTPSRLAAEKHRVAVAEERAAFSRFWRRVGRGAVAVAVAAFGVAAWGVEQIPVIRELYRAGRDLVAWWHGS